MNSPPRNTDNDVCHQAAEPSSIALTAHTKSVAHQIAILTAIFVILTWNQESRPDSRPPNQAKTRGSLPTDRLVTESAFATWQLNSSCVDLIVVFTILYSLE